MEAITIESIPIVVGREKDGRWWADIESMPGVMAYGASRDSAIAAVRALALRVAVDRIEHVRQNAGCGLKSRPTGGRRICRSLDLTGRRTGSRGCLRRAGGPPLEFGHFR